MALNKAQMAKELSLIGVVIGVIPALAGTAAALSYVHSYVFPRTEADDLKVRITAVESHQNVQEDHHLADMREIRASLSDITKLILSVKQSADAAQAFRDKFFTQKQTLPAAFKHSQNAGPISREPEATLDSPLRGLKPFGLKIDRFTGDRIDGGEVRDVQDSSGS